MNTVFLQTAMGRIAVSEQDGTVVKIDLTPSVCEEHHTPVLEQAKAELLEYFAGERKIFTFPWHLTGVPPFAEKVLLILSELHYGEIITYGALAGLAGNPKACRAAGQAVHRNPLPVVIPCHRVLAANGETGGFASGLKWKRFLLNIEEKNLFKNAVFPD